MKAANETGELCHSHLHLALLVITNILRDADDEEEEGHLE